MSKINVYVERLAEDVVLPTYAKYGDSGMDVQSRIDVNILPGETVIIPTGLKVAIPKGYEIQVRPRSGMSFKTPLRVSNAPGTVDSGFRDEIGVIITNTSHKFDWKISKGDRIAQFVLQAVPFIEWVETDDVTKIGQNRNGGFGSTGK